MEVRDAVEADADRLASLTGSPRDVMVNLVHDRTVRVAVEEGDGDGTAPDEGEGDGEGDGEGEGEGEDEDERRVQGFVSFDARDDTVHVTQLEGEPTVCDRLLEEPVGFAEREGMTVELLVPEDERDTRDAAETAGFEQAGTGPAFEGRPTIRYRLDPT